MTPDELRVQLDEFARGDVDWRRGRSWSLVYDSPDWHRTLVNAAAARFADGNALSHAAFRSAAELESRIIEMCASVLSPKAPAHGIFTSGGTESTMVAVKAYRDIADPRRRRIVAPASVHPALGKAAAYLGMHLVRVPLQDGWRVEADSIIAALDDQTALVVLSAPCFPYGQVDPIHEIATAASALGVPVHVDAALGGLFLPFLDAVGMTPPAFTLEVPGVTSVAVDLHKYGYGAKGASVVLFRDAAVRRAAYHLDLEWPGGAYASSGVLGTRSVGPAAAAYTAMACLGLEGYRGMVAQVMGTATRLRSGLSDAGFEVVGCPPMSVFAVVSDRVSVPAVAETLAEQGWWIDQQAEPPAMHFIVFPRHAAFVDEFLADVSRAVKWARSGRSSTAPGTGYQVMVRHEGPISNDVLAEDLDQRFDLPRGLGGSSDART